MIEFDANLFRSDALAIARADRCDDAWAHFDRAIGRYGFDRAMYGLTLGIGPRTLGRLEEVFYLSSTDPAYTEAFVAAGHYEHSPMARWARENVGACSWRFAQELRDAGRFTAAQRRLSALNALHGVRSGYTISFPPTSRGARAALSVIAPADTDQADVEAGWARCGDAVELLGNLLHLRVLSLPRVTAGVSLTPRHREVLDRIAIGMTAREIAADLGRTPKAIEKRLSEAKRILAVETTAEAILRAADLNQIAAVPLERDTVPEQQIA